VGVAGAAACTSATTGDVGGGSLAAVQLSDSVLRLRVGTEGALSARVLDASGQEVSGRKLFWSVRDDGAVQGWCGENGTTAWAPDRASAEATGDRCGPRREGTRGHRCPGGPPSTMPRQRRVPAVSAPPW